MPSSVAEIFSAAGLTVVDHVRWGELIPVRGPGVYVVASTPDLHSTSDVHHECPLSRDVVAGLLGLRVELRLDGARPNTDDLCGRLAGMWLGDEVVVYVGLAGTSLRRRVGDYYRTALGARRPHAGGWPVKTLAGLPDLWVHFASSDDPAVAEEAMLRHFAERVSDSALGALHDPRMPIPFANLELTRSERKRHGITGAREPARTIGDAAGSRSQSEGDFGTA